MTCTSPITLGWPYNIKAPCGRCLGCRKARTREWAARIVHEMSTWDKGSFVTLTYDDENLPMDSGLHKEDLQKFFKRLRKCIYPEKIKYYACGEYGTRYKRPHYHAIIFGIGVSIDDNKNIADAWGKGFVRLDEVNYKTAAYVAGYIQKKNYGLSAEYEYGWKEKPFQLQSQGIGKEWMEKNKDYIMDNLCITVNGEEVGIPRYYVKKLEIDTSLFNKDKMDKLDKVRERLQELKVEPMEEWRFVEKQRRQKDRTNIAKAALRPRKDM